MIFNNGNCRPEGDYSTVEILTSPVDANGFHSSAIPYLPEAADWVYVDPVPANFYAANISGAQMLQSGNVCSEEDPALYAAGFPTSKGHHRRSDTNRPHGLLLPLWW